LNKRLGVTPKKQIRTLEPRKSFRENGETDLKKVEKDKSDVSFPPIRTETNEIDSAQGESPIHSKKTLDPIAQAEKPK
jgi:hypothetical protein